MPLWNYVVTDYKHVHNFRKKDAEKPNYVADVNLWNNLYKILEIFKNFWKNDFYHIWSASVFTL